MRDERIFRFCQVFVQLYFLKRNVRHQRLANFTSISRLIRASHEFSFCQKELNESFVKWNVLFFFFLNNLIHILIVHLILRTADVSWIFRLRRFRVSNKRCLICSQKLLINVSCLWFFMRCLNDICKRIMCSWIDWTWVFVSRICIEIALKLSLITRKLCCWSLSSFFVVATTLFERSCDAYQIVES
jgi:hypothetical protein